MSADSAGQWTRLIVHADMDAFYAAIEQLDRPELRGKPVLVGPKSQRGVVLTASYEARPYRVGSAMPMALARRRCPTAIIVPPRFERYQQVSATVMQVFRDFAPNIEPLSLDEAFLDMSGSTRVLGSAREIGEKIRAGVRDATGGLTVSVGMSTSKFVAKVASGHRKPDGLTIVPPAEVRGWLAALPVAALWGAGSKTQARLRSLGLVTMGDVATADPAWLEKKLGRLGRRFHALARGEDARVVVGGGTARSLSSERTLERDIATFKEIDIHLRKAADMVAARLRKASLLAGGVRVKLRKSDFSIVSRQRMLPSPTASSAPIYAAAQPLARELLNEAPFRLVGVAAYALSRKPAEGQLDLLTDGAGRSEQLDAVMDSVSNRFGAGALRRASQLRPATVLDDSPDLDFLETDTD